MMAQGWLRHTNLNNGDYNNDLTTSDIPCTKWSFSFTGNGISIIAPKQAGAGKIEVLIDGKAMKTVDLSATTTRKNQQVVYHVDKLAQANHTVSIINRGGGQVAIDALIVSITRQSLGRIRSKK